MQNEEYLLIQLVNKVKKHISEHDPKSFPKPEGVLLIPKLAQTV